MEKWYWKTYILTTTCAFDSACLPQNIIPEVINFNLTFTHSMVTTHSSRATYRGWLTYNMKVKVRNTRQYTIVLLSAIFMRGKCPQSYQICTTVSSHNLYMGLFLSTCIYTIVTTYSIPRDGMDNLEYYYLQKQHNYSHQVQNNFYLEIDIVFIFIRGYYIIPKGIKGKYL